MTILEQVYDTCFIFKPFERVWESNII